MYVAGFGAVQIRDAGKAEMNMSADHEFPNNNASHYTPQLNEHPAGRFCFLTSRHTFLFSAVQKAVARLPLIDN